MLNSLNNYREQYGIYTHLSFYQFSDLLLIQYTSIHVYVCIYIYTYIHTKNVSTLYRQNFRSVIYKQKKKKKKWYIKFVRKCFVTELLVNVIIECNASTCVSANSKFDNT